MPDALRQRLAVGPARTLAHDFQDVGHARGVHAGAAAGGGGSGRRCGEKFEAEVDRVLAGGERHFVEEGLVGEADSVRDRRAERTGGHFAEHQRLVVGVVRDVAGREFVGGESALAEHGERAGGVGTAEA